MYGINQSEDSFMVNFLVQRTSETTYDSGRLGFRCPNFTDCQWDLCVHLLLTPLKTPDLGHKDRAGQPNNGMSVHIKDGGMLPQGSTGAGKVVVILLFWSDNK